MFVFDPFQVSMNFNKQIQLTA